jgi:hypothetical protein
MVPAFDRLEVVEGAGLLHEPSREHGQTMNQFEYEITAYSAEDFKEVVYFCSPDGQCGLERLPADQIRKLQQVLTERGRKGWELIQASFGKEGILAFWKRSAQGAALESGTPASGPIDI